VELLKALINYLWIVVTDGDWANDWLTHLPMAMRQEVETFGRILARMIADVGTCGDPTLKSGEEAFIWLAKLMAALFDLVCF